MPNCQPRPEVAAVRRSWLREILRQGFTQPAREETLAENVNLHRQCKRPGDPIEPQRRVFSLHDKLMLDWAKQDCKSTLRNDPHGDVNDSMPTIHLHELSHLRQILQAREWAAALCG